MTAGGKGAEGASSRASRDRLRLRRDLRLARIALDPDEPLLAASSLMLIVGAVSTSLGLFAFLSVGIKAVAPSVLFVILSPIIAREMLLSHPSRSAARRSRLVLKHSAAPANLMIMSLRHEPSISTAISFASQREDEFSKELRASIWGVIMGRFESFEEALLDLGRKWGELGDDLKTAVNSMVTSSREATQDGRRRALDRANNAIITGSKRRIEEFAASLSVPSMLIFGLGILLPLMVGSFLPMLSWNLWSMDAVSQEAGQTEAGGSISQMVFVMNLLFPAIALLVAMNAVSEHPLEAGGSENRTNPVRADWGILAFSLSAVLVAASSLALDESTVRSAAMLFAATGPVSVWLVVVGRRDSQREVDEGRDLEDVLFRTGTRMLEGENFESALHKAAEDLERGASKVVRRISLGSVMGAGAPIHGQSRAPQQFGMENAFQGLSIAREAASKDEQAAGALMMDLAGYVKDLRELENTLKNRLKPTVSMMKTTALVLAPIVLGVTYAICLTLSSMLGGDAGPGQGVFFLVLGLFLAEMDAILVYFVWGVEGKKGLGVLARNIGSYVLVSETAFSATALLASA